MFEDYYNYDGDEDQKDEPMSSIEWFDLRSRRKRQISEVQKKESSVIYTVCVGWAQKTVSLCISIIDLLYKYSAELWLFVWSLWNQLFFFVSVFTQHEKEEYCWHGHGGSLTSKRTDTKHQGFGTCAYAFFNNSKKKSNSVIISVLHDISRTSFYYLIIL